MLPDLLDKIIADKPNTVSDLYFLMTSIPAIFRDHVCNECDWSIPTFYRKVRTNDRIDPTNPKKVISVISNAEREKIRGITEKIHEAIGTYLYAK
ncbi:hypothetical protein [Chitinophaga polysaccharea]|uniref:hypothetical protein n=1 Tax=Chitinophaga polysaccharea TaxID=1293035 RepID=UPI001157CAA8|nr:hypothetical protein [Chitinophaga polysaccharea]